MKWNITEKELREIILNSNNKTDVLKNLNLKNFGGNYNTLTSYIKLFNIDISHFGRTKNLLNQNYIKRDLTEILVEKSDYKSSNHLKERLYKEGLKERICEMCGQGEEWNGKHMSLILDHKNGVPNDNRIENLRIVCPNCNATLDTHCGKNLKSKIQPIKIKKEKKEHICPECGNIMAKNSDRCLECYKKDSKKRKVERPPYEQLIIEINELGYSGTGRKYNVSDNSIRKWLKNYEN
jgi:ribosomal protein S27AE